MACLNSFDHGLAAAVGQIVYEIYTGIVHRQYVERCKYAYIWSHDRFCLNALAVARDRHVSHRVDEAYMRSEMVDHGLGALRDPLHEFLFCYTPRVISACRSMYLFFAYTSVSAAYSYIFIAPSEASHCMPFEMCQYKERIIVKKVFSDMHLCEPLASVYRQRSDSVCICNIDRAECPSVDLKGLSMLFSCIPVTFVVCIGLNYNSIRKAFRQQLLYPWSWQNVRSFCLPGVQLYSYPAFQSGSYLVIYLFKPFLTEISGEEYD